MCQLQGSLLPANRELATIPDASRIAFDPPHRRVWRICARCGEWNLLGAEAAERALPELEARFAAAPKRVGGEGFAPARVGSALEILQIGATAVASDAVLRKRRKQITVAKRVTIAALECCGADVSLLWNVIEYHMHGLAQMCSQQAWSGAGQWST